MVLRLIKSVGSSRIRALRVGGTGAETPCSNFIISLLSSWNVAICFNENARCTGRIAVRTLARRSANDQHAGTVVAVCLVLILQSLT